MEAVMFYSSADQKNYLGSSKKFMNQGSMIPRFSENFVPANFQGPILQAPVPNHPPFLYQSFPLFSQPPLLPLPIKSNSSSINLNQNRTLSLPPNYGRSNKSNNNNKNRNRDSSLTPKKSKQILKATKQVVDSSSAPLGPDPAKLPKDVPKVLSLSSKEDEGDKFSGCVIYTVSPPPSSLPLPTFSLRPKLSCNAEASAGVDTGATDNLCRLLRLR